eukprot:1618905-Rhodomonas_salina.1
MAVLTCTMAVRRERDEAPSGMPLCACYAVSGTDVGHAATRCGVLMDAMWGTALAYGAMGCAVLR